MSLKTNSEAYETHITSCRSSGLSVKSYSAQQGLNYATFLYHYRKRYPKTNKAQLVSVRLKSEDVQDEEPCRIELRTGDVLWCRDRELLLSMLPILLS